MSAVVVPVGWCLMGLYMGTHANNYLQKAAAILGDNFTRVIEVDGLLQYMAPAWVWHTLAEWRVAYSNAPLYQNEEYIPAAEWFMGLDHTAVKAVYDLGGPTAVIVLVRNMLQAPSQGST